MNNYTIEDLISKYNFTIKQIKTFVRNGLKIHNNKIFIDDFKLFEKEHSIDRNIWIESKKISNELNIKQFNVYKYTKILKYPLQKISTLDDISFHRKIFIHKEDYNNIIEHVKNLKYRTKFGCKKKSIDNKNIKIININSIIYEDVVYKSHPILKNLFFNSNNIKHIIKYEKDKYFFHSYSILKRDMYREQITFNKKTYNVSKLIAETFKDCHTKNTVVSHFDDISNNNEISNLYFMSGNDNNVMAGLNDKICKNLYLLIKTKYSEIYNTIIKHNDIFTNNNFKTFPLPYTYVKNNEQYIKVDIPHIDNLYISLNGKSIIHNDKQLIIQNLRCCIPNDGFYSYKGRKIWQLMAFAKYGFFKCENTMYGNVILHLNDIQTDNSYDNIFIGDRKLNAQIKKTNTIFFKKLRVDIKNLYSNDIYKELINTAISLLDKDYKNKFDTICNKYKIVL